MLLKTGIFLAFLTFVASIPFESEYEYVFNYNGYLSTWTDTPKEYQSYTRINADIHVILLDQNLWMQLENVTYTTHSGSTDDDEATPVPISEDVKVISLPFLFLKYANNTSSGIMVQPEDPKWSTNIKQSIANLFYLDEKVFSAEETGIQPAKSFTKEKYSYYVLPSEDGIVVNKILTDDYYKVSSTLNKKNPTLPITKRLRYDLKKENGVLFLKTVNFVSKMDFRPYEGYGINIFATVKQSLEYQIKKSTNEKKPTKELTDYREVVFTSETYLTDAGTYDITSGRSLDDMDKIMASLKEDIEYLERTITKSELDSKYDVNFLIWRLQQLNIDHLKQLHDKLLNSSGNTKVLKLFLKALTLSGTPAANSFVIDLIQNNKVEEGFVTTLLQSIPEHIMKFPNNLQEQFSNLLKSEFEPQAVLPLASIISYVEQHQQHDVFIDYFTEKLKSSSDDQKRILYINALRNIRSEKTHTVLKKIVKNNSGEFSGHVRASAMLGLNRGHKYDNFLWLILMDASEEFEVRATALRMLLDLQYPENYEKVYWILTEDKDADIQRLFFTTMRGISKITIPQFSTSSKRAANVLEMIEKNKDVFKSSQFIFDYAEDTFQFGSMLKMAFYGNMGKHNFTMYHVEFLEKSSNPEWTSDEYYLYLRWIHNDIQKKFTNILDDYQKIAIPYDIEFVHVKNGQVKSITNFDSISLEMLTQPLILRKYDKLDIDQDFHKYIVIPTDLGYPLVFFNQFSSFGSFSKNDSNIVNTNLIVFDVNYKDSQTYGFASFNPIVNMWYGIRRVQSLTVNIPFDLPVELMSTTNFRHVYSIPEKPFGFDSYVYTQVFMGSKEKMDTVKSSCSNCQQSTFVTNGRDSLDNYTFLDGENKDIGLNYKLGFYDCETRFTQTNPKTMLSIFNQDSNYDEIPSAKLFIGAYRLWKHSTRSPGTSMCGFGFKMEKIKGHPATDVEVNIDRDFDAKMNDKIDKFTVNLKMISNYSIVVRNEKEIFKSYYINTNFTVRQNEKQYLQYYTLTGSTDSPDAKVCFKSYEASKNDDIYSEMEFSIGCQPEGSSPKILVKSLAEMSEEQKKDGAWGKPFQLCMDDPKYTFKDCIAAVSSYCSYKYNITYENLTQKHLSYLMRISDTVSFLYGDEFVRMEYPVDKLSPGNVKIELNYPLFIDFVNVSVVTEHEAYRYDDIYFGDMLRMDILSPVSPFIAKEKNSKGRFCEVGIDYVRDFDDSDKFPLNITEEWTVIAEGSENDWEIKVKKMKIDERQNNSNTEEDGDLMLQVKVDDEIIEVSYWNAAGDKDCNENGCSELTDELKEADFKIRIDGKLVSLQSETRYRSGKWIDYMVPNYDGRKRVIIHTRHTPINVEYDRNVIRLTLPTNGHNGECYLDTFKQL